MSTVSFSGMSVKDIHTAALWSSPCPFIGFCLLDMSGSFSGSLLTRTTQVEGVSVSYVTSDCTQRNSSFSIDEMRGVQGVCCMLLILAR